MTKLGFSKAIAVVGSGPAGLMAAWVLANAGRNVVVIEKHAALGRKILIAGSSGLNVSFDSPLDQFVQIYKEPQTRWQIVLNAFSPNHWLEFIQGLGLEVFRGSNGRYFVQGMKGSSLLKVWIEQLKSRGVEFKTLSPVTGFVCSNDGVMLQFADQGDRSEKFKAVLFALGGGSWDKTPEGVRWPEMFNSHELKIHPFQSSNCGYQVAWPSHLLTEAEGQPLKNIGLKVGSETRKGELIITRYGLEGTPVYTIGKSGPVWIDLKPDLSESQILSKLSSSKKNLSPLRLAKKNLNLCPASLALLFHLTPKEELQSAANLAAKIKNFPLELLSPQPLSEAISSRGGLDWNELDDQFMIKKCPGVFAAGEMLDWDAPTGGFLIQGCVSQGHAAGNGILNWQP